MKLNCKKYKVQRFKNYFIYKNLFFLYTEFNSSSKKKNIKQSQVFPSHESISLIVVNSALKFFLKNSIFKNLVLSMTGYIVLKSFNKSSNLNLTFKNLIKLNTNSLLFGIKLNKNIYSVTQLKTLSSLNYKKNILILHKSLKKNISYSYFKLLNIR